MLPAAILSVALLSGLAAWFVSASLLDRLLGRGWAGFAVQVVVCPIVVLVTAGAVVLVAIAVLPAPPLDPNGPLPPPIPPALGR